MKTTAMFFILLTVFFKSSSICTAKGVGSTGGGKNVLAFEFERPSVDARTDTLKAYYANGMYLIYATGLRKSDLLEPAIENCSGQGVFPPAFCVKLYGTAGPLKMQPFHVLKLVRIKKERRLTHLTVYTADGKHEVPVEDLPQEMLGNSTVPIITAESTLLGNSTVPIITALRLDPTVKAVKGRVFDGVSTSLSLDEAYADTIRQHKAFDTGVADDRLQTYFISARTVHGEIAGVEMMVVTVYGIYDSEK